jgi:ubiquinone/menaquinone biosynthesis C-methylase UbiE
MVNLWPNGYEEDFKGMGKQSFIDAISLLHGETCLEIGCGNGKWTMEFLAPKFKVTAIDIIDNPKYLKGVEYHKVTGCNLKGFDYFDCVYSNGVFCHLPIECQMSYLKEVRRVLKGKGVIMLANWDRHPSLKHIKADYHDTWYYNNLEKTDKMMKEAGLNWIDFDKNHRDTIAIVW